MVAVAIKSDSKGIKLIAGIAKRMGGEVVKLDDNEYNSIQETDLLSRSKNNRDRLDLAVENIKTKNNLLKKNLVEE